MDEEERDKERERVRRRRRDRVYLGPMTNVCQYCQALRFPNELLNCCHSGKVRLPQLESYPTELKDLLTSTTTESCNFHNNIRQYNSAYSFASFGAQMEQVSDVYHFTYMITLLHMFHFYASCYRCLDKVPTASRYMVKHTIPLLLYIHQRARTESMGSYTSLKETRQ